jgi:hypothetical protein
MSTIETSSTGPRTEAGKAVSSRNAVKHNLCSKSLTGADLEQFLEIRARFDEEWQPATETENLLLDQMALSQWRMDRALSLELNAFDNDHIDEKLLALALRYRTTAPRPNAASTKHSLNCSASARRSATTPSAAKSWMPWSAKPPSTAKWSASASLPSPRCRPNPFRRTQLSLRSASALPYQMYLSKTIQSALRPFFVEPPQLYTAVNRTRNTVLARRVSTATSSKDRRQGLLSKTSTDDGEGLRIAVCLRAHSVLEIAAGAAARSGTPALAADRTWDHIIRGLSS